MTTTAVASVGVKLESPHMILAAGENAEQEISLVNETLLPDDFDLSIEGLPQGWCSFSSESVNLFPNWSETVKFRVDLTGKVRPNTYHGRIVVRSRSQPNIKTEVKLELEVISSLRIAARLQPHRSSGFTGHYKVRLRNSSMSECQMFLSLTSNTDMVMGTFTPTVAIVPPNGVQEVPLKVQLKPKTPGDQTRQSQGIQVVVQPQWILGGNPFVKDPVTLKGEYAHVSRWSVLARHPFLVGLAITIILIYILWSILFLPAIQNAFLLSVENAKYTGPIKNSTMRLDQKSLNDTLPNFVPFYNFLAPQIRLYEADQSMTIHLHYLFVEAETKGTVQINPSSRLLEFVPQDKKDMTSMPWVLAPPDQIFERVSKKLGTWANSQASMQRLDRSEIEGDTLYIRTTSCSSNESGCPYDPKAKLTPQPQR